MGYCAIHGNHKWDECSICASRERQEENAHKIIEGIQESIQANQDALRDQVYQTNNPGDYTCPECGYITLRRNAKRCPKCQGTVSREHWVKLEAQEENKRKLTEQKKLADQLKAQQEWERTAPERKLAELEKNRADRFSAARSETILYFGYLLPAFSVLTSYVFWQTKNRFDVIELISSLIAALLPFANWLFVVSSLKKTSEDPMVGILWNSLTVWAVIGVVGILVYWVYWPRWFLPKNKN